MSSSSTAWIPAPLVEILDYIVENDPEYSGRSEIVKKATWEWVKNHPLYKSFLNDVAMYDKHGKDGDAALVTTPEPAEAQA